MFSITTRSSAAVLLAASSFIGCRAPASSPLDTPSSEPNRSAENSPPLRAIHSPTLQLNSTIPLSFDGVTLLLPPGSEITRLANPRPYHVPPGVPRPPSLPSETSMRPGMSVTVSGFTLPSGAFPIAERSGFALTVELRPAGRAGEPALGDILAQHSPRLRTTKTDFSLVTLNGALQALKEIDSPEGAVLVRIALRPAAGSSVDERSAGRAYAEDALERFADEMRIESKSGVATTQTLRGFSLPFHGRDRCAVELPAGWTVEAPMASTWAEVQGLFTMSSAEHELRHVWRVRATSPQSLEALVNEAIREPLLSLEYAGPDGLDHWLVVTQGTTSETGSGAPPRVELEYHPPLGSPRGQP